MSSFKSWRDEKLELDKKIADMKRREKEESDMPIDESVEALFEKLITLGNRAYPKFGNIVIMAGGAGSGKGFVYDKLIGIEGKVLDVDALKTLASQSSIIRNRVKTEHNVDLEDLIADTKNPENVAILHKIINDKIKLPDRRQEALHQSIIKAPADRKPNLIFDVTLSNPYKMQNIAYDAAKMGYDKKNIHIVWVVNDIEVARQQNQKRSRVVPDYILVNTHRGAANTIGELINLGKDLQRHMDGDIVFAFNKVGVDSSIDKSGKGGAYLKDAEYVYVKHQGKPPISVEDLDADIRRKIASYVPKGVAW